ncbi:glycogen synthase [Actinomarinicola tropica]|uniref:Glycogen synthase n=1 Tax=Actinomarinicola tropica TaxID=2789776 RepID=A0A5Q2RP05_9ACTN|nr:glycogen synthase [Actinomarinicola tropica]QGG96321.1 glycogen synthase [Actinomarinicola tropica]
MRVAVCTREFPPEVYGGAGVHVEYLTRELDRLVDVEVHAFGAPRPSPLVARTYQPWDALAGDRPHDAALEVLSVDLAMAAGLEGVDLIHSHTWYAGMAGHLAAMTYGRPHVTTAHSLEPLRPWKAEQLGGGYRLSSWAERTALAGADAVVAVSHGMRADLLRCYPDVDPARVHVVHNGIDTDEYRPDPGSDHLVALGVDPERPFVLFVGRITRQKGISLLLDAVGHLGSDAQVVLLAGSPDTPEIESEVRDKVATLTDRRGGVLWIDDLVPRPAVVQLMSRASVFVCPSVYEPFGLINVEAMACETPVVASAVGGIPEIVVDGETGHLVPFEVGDDPYGGPADPDRFARDLAGRIDEVLGDPASGERMGQAGRARVLERFAWPEIAARTVELYRSLL